MPNTVTQQLIDDDFDILVDSILRGGATPPNRWYEITSGAMRQSEDHEDLFEVQANTTAGLWSFHAVSFKTLIDEHLRDFVEGLRRQRRPRQLHWNTKTPSGFVSGSRALRLVKLHGSPPDDRETVFVTDAPTELEPSVAEVLEKLRSCDAREKRQLVLLLECLPFDDRTREEACHVLRAFICQHRDSQNSDDLIAVGAALRKLVLNLPADELDEVSWLLEAGHRGSPSADVELEVVKSLVWKLLANVPATSNAHPALADRLLEMAEDYLNDRFLPRDKNVPTALNVVMALALLRSHVDEVAEMVNDLQLSWFKQLVARRAAKLVDDLRPRVGAEGVAEAIEALEAMQQFASAS